MANDNTVYSFIWTETHKGPLVAEIPSKVLGRIDFWYRRLSTSESRAPTEVRALPTLGSF
jgi:hypothetical protein